MLQDLNQPSLNGYYITTGTCLFVAEWIAALDGYHIPNIVMQIFQCVAWGTASVACIIGVYWNYKKRKSTKFHDPN